eukprot:2180830-Pleurochrysis_carterae.AAC.1
MQDELAAYHIEPQSATLFFFKETVMFETTKIRADQGGDIPAEDKVVHLAQYNVVRCKETGYYFVVVDLFKPIAGFK